MTEQTTYQLLNAQGNVIATYSTLGQAKRACEHTLNSRIRIVPKRHRTRKNAATPPQQESNMTKRTFTCFNCKRTMESDWSEEEAKAEFAANFPGIPFEEAGDPLCD